MRFCICCGACLFWMASWQWFLLYKLQSSLSQQVVNKSSALISLWCLKAEGGPPRGTNLPNVLENPASPKA
ncbi:hypothetical protein M758_11G167600 [Ceratodon purpureus]|uniref:Secreted protein n=1 Tax=Ceratodon purpureus TaxID=3225 RepID=A0A8T0GLT8_CERPU|nr:hypothetical protein KC19_11G171800 [Ceratodon purpureus]KAG0602208.1 hypothetical protein M758_11G167600 [Ceratodon purpureus]